MSQASVDVIMKSPPTVVPVPVEIVKVEHDGSPRSDPPLQLTQDKDLCHDLVQIQIQELAVALEMPPLEYDTEESQMPSIEEEEARTLDNECQGMPPLEEDAGDDMASAAVSPLQSDSADATVLPCPERPEEIELTTGPWRVLHHPAMFCRQNRVSLSPYSPGEETSWIADPSD